MNNYSIDDYIEILNSSLSSIDSTIDQLKNKKKYVTRNLIYLQDLKSIKTHYHVLHIPEKVLYIFHTGKILEYTIKEMYEIINRKNIDYLDTNHDSYFIPLDNDNFSIGILKTSEIEEFKEFEGFDSIILPGGTYLNYNIFLENYNEFDI